MLFFVHGICAAGRPRPGRAAHGAVLATRARGRRVWLLVSADSAGAARALLAARGVRCIEWMD